MIRQTLATLLEPVLKDLEIPADTLKFNHPVFLKQGDYATAIALLAAKKLGKNPQELAQQIAAKIPPHPFIQKVEIAPTGFINFYFSKEFFVHNLGEIATQGETFGHSQQLQGKTFLIEHTSANPNKAMHLGHLLNNIYGMAVSRLWEAQGAKVIRDYIDNNRGIAIAKLMWGYLKFGRKDKAEDKMDISYWFEHQGEWQVLDDLKIRPDRFIDDLYVKATAQVESNKQIESAVRQMVVDWESGQEKNRALWMTVLKLSYAGQQATLARLGSKVDTVWHESDHYQQGKELIAEGLKKGIFRRLEDGAVITDLEKQYQLPDTVLIKSDGTSLYITQDIALTKLKKETFHPDHIFWVIGNDQALAMSQLFAVCDQLGIGKTDEFTHLKYGWLNIKGQGKMSSRKGNVVYIDDLLDAAGQEIKKKIKKEQFDKGELDGVCEKIALSAIKYAIARVSPTSTIEFDLESTVDFNGDSGPYLQYTYARAQSAIKKSEEKNIIPSIQKVPATPLEIEQLLYRFPEVVSYAASINQPHLLCTYLFELAKSFNLLYATYIIADPTDPEAPYRLAVVQATAQVLANGLRLLGMDVLEKM